MDFDELLATYKAAPRRESVAVLLTDAALLNYCVIFKQCPPVRRRRDPNDEGGALMEPVEATWAALWGCVEFDFAALALLADDEVVRARQMVERLKGLRLVFPDGSMQDLVMKVVTKRIMDAVV